MIRSLRIYHSMRRTTFHSSLSLYQKITKTKVMRTKTIQMMLKKMVLKRSKSKPRKSSVRLTMKMKRSKKRKKILSSSKICLIMKESVRESKMSRNRWRESIIIYLIVKTMTISTDLFRTITSKPSTTVMLWRRQGFTKAQSKCDSCSRHSIKRILFQWNPCR